MPARIARSSFRSPATRVQPSASSAAPFAGLRTSATTSSPRARNWRTTAPPMNPVPPVTKTFTRTTLTGVGGAVQCLRVSQSRTGRKTETRYAAQNGNGAGVVNRRAKQRALAIGIVDGREHGEPLAELQELLRTAGVETVGMATQQRPKPDPDRYFGRGRLEELKTEIAAADAKVVPFDGGLLPRQERNLETALGVPVVDRTAVILDIFADHAHSAEGKLQVELAQLEYNMARMRGLWTHLERLGGGIGTRGPGESQIETDRRLARDRIAALRRR